MKGTREKHLAWDLALTIMLGALITGALATLFGVWDAWNYPSEHIKGVEQLSAAGKVLRDLRVGLIIGAIGGAMLGAWITLVKLTAPEQ